MPARRQVLPAGKVGQVEPDGVAVPVPCESAIHRLPAAARERRQRLRSGAWPANPHSRPCRAVPARPRPRDPQHSPARAGGRSPCRRTLRRACHGRATQRNGGHVAACSRRLRRWYCPRLWSPPCPVLPVHRRSFRLRQSRQVQQDRRPAVPAGDTAVSRQQVAQARRWCSRRPSSALAASICARPGASIGCASRPGWRRYSGIHATRQAGIPRAAAQPPDGARLVLAFRG